MPQFAIKFSGVKKVPANSLLGNSTGSAASASGLSASDARTLLGLATSDSPTFGGLEFPASAIINAASGGLFFRSGGSNIFGYTGGQFTAYKSINPADTTRDLGSIAAGKPWRTLVVGQLASTSNVIEQRNGANGQQLSIFNTFTDSSNNEGFKIDWQTLTNYCLLETFANGTGVAREMRLQAGAGRFYLKASGSTYAVVTDGSGNEKYDFINGTFSSRSGASLGTSSSPWGEVHCGGITTDGAFNLTTPSGTANDVRVKVDDGGTFFELYSYSTSASPYLRIGGPTPGTSGATTIRHFESGGTHWTNIGQKDGASLLSIHQSHAAATLQADGYWGFSDSSSASYDATPDTRLYRDGADILAMRNGTTANEFRVYNTYTDASNNEFFAIDWNTQSNVVTLKTGYNGTGTYRDIDVYNANSRTLRLTHSIVKVYRHMRFNSTVYDLGETVTNSCPRNIFANGKVESHALALVDSSSDPSDPASGQSIMWQSDGTGSGDDGDIMMKITDSGGTTKTVTLVDYSSAGGGIP